MLTVTFVSDANAPNDLPSTSARMFAHLLGENWGGDSDRLVYELDVELTAHIQQTLDSDPWVESWHEY